MMNIARRVCRNHPEHWDDIIQEGYISLLSAAESWDGRQEFGQYAVKYLRLHMMREGTKHRAFLRGVAIRNVEAKNDDEPNRRVLIKDFDNGKGDPLSSQQILEELAVFETTPEDTAVHRDLVWEVRRAAWTVAERMQAHKSTWKYTLLRDCILTNNKTTKEVSKRFGKYPGSVYFFVNNFQKHMRAELGVML